VSKTQDNFIAEKLKRSSTITHSLIITPNAWMKYMNVEPDEISKINEDIKDTLYGLEAEARAERIVKGYKVMGAKRLASEALDLEYRSKSKSRRIFVYAACKEIRIQMIKDYKYFCDRCAECYQRWKLGDYSVSWPPGAFLPPGPPTINHFTDAHQF